MVLNIISIGTITILSLSFTQSSSDGNITVSSVILKPNRRQSGQVVTCRVKNNLKIDDGAEDGCPRILNVMLI